MNRTPWKPIDIRTTWKCGKGPTPWSRRRLCLSVVVFRAPYRFLLCEKLEKFLHCGCVERVLYRGSMDDYADPLLGIKYPNDSRKRR